MAAQASKLLDDSQRVVVASQLGAAVRRPARRHGAPARPRRGVERLADGSSLSGARNIDDGWAPDEAPAPFETEVTLERPRSIITRNQSPDIAFDRSINPYRGCEHGCFYCFARPSHAYLGLSAGLDFESKLFVKDGAAALLERELAAPKYRPRGDRARRQHRRLSADRAAATASPAPFSKCSRARATPSASSPSPIWCCAISIFSRRWRPTASSRCSSR